MKVDAANSTPDGAPQGMVAWAGGDSAPTDIGECSEVLHADGSIGLANKRSILWGRPTQKLTSRTYDDTPVGPGIETKWIIAYTPQPTSAVASAPRTQNRADDAMIMLCGTCGSTDIREQPETFPGRSPAYCAECRADHPGTPTFYPPWAPRPAPPLSAKERCQAPGCDNLTDRGICDDCDLWVDREVAKINAEHAADRICLDVAELPDRTSPDDWPEAMLVTSDELRTIVLAALTTAEPDADQPQC